MEKFTASNGYAVGTHPKGYGVTTFGPDGRNMVAGYEHLLDEEVVALREFFLHERDQELGRWRWAECPDYVVYPVTAQEVRVFSESTGVTERVWRGEELPGAYLHDAALAYFAAHPEPKPWHSAVTGEVWELDLDFGDVGKRDAFMADNRGESVFRRLGELYPTNDSRIAGGRRIWPEGE